MSFYQAVFNKQLTKMRGRLTIFFLTFFIHIWSSFLAAKEYYIVQEEKRSWYGAFRDCHLRGLQLATINSHVEQNALELAMKKAGASEELLWTSGTDQGDEGNFFWMSSGLGISYAYFTSGEPNNAQNNEHCLHIWPRKNVLGWNDWVCTTKLFYVCEDKWTEGCFCNVTLTNGIE